MTHSITRPRYFTGTNAQALRMEARRIQALRNKHWEEEMRRLEDDQVWQQECDENYQEYIRALKEEK